MPDTIGNITVPEIAPSGVFPVVPDYQHGRAWRPDVAIHQFGSGNAKIEQRFLLGTGAKRFTVRRASLRDSDRIALRNFFESKYGAYGAFTYNAPNDDGVGTTAYTCRFANEPLSWEMVADHICTVGLTLIEIPATPPTYTLNSTLTRFPTQALKDALLSQVQRIVPLVKIQPLQSGYPVIYLSDRRCTIGGQLYHARLLEFDGIQQGMGGESDDASFTFGKGRVTAGASLTASDLPAHSHVAGDVVSGAFGVNRGGTGLTTVAANKLLYSPSPDTLAELSVGSGLSLAAGVISLGTHTHAATDIVSGSLALARGGTGADLSATGPGFLRQASAGATVTVAALSSGDVTGALGYTPASKAGDTFTGALHVAGDQAFVECGPYQTVGGAFENMAKYAEDFSVAAWDKNGGSCSVSANSTTAPDSNATADMVTASTATPIIQQQIAGLVDGGTYTFYVWAKVASGTQKVSLAIVNNAYGA